MAEPIMKYRQFPQLHLQQPISEIPSFVSYSADIVRGSNYIYRWFFSDSETNSSHIGLPKLKLDLVVPCNLTIDLQVEDSFGSLWARMTTVVQYPILNVSMTIYRTIVGQPTRIIVVVEPQQDYTVLLDFGDGDSISIYSHESLIKGCFYSPLFCSVLAYEHNFTQASNYTVTLIVSNAVSRVEQVAEAVVEEPIVGMDVTLVTPHQIKLGDLINATVYFPSGSEFVFTWLFCGPFTCYSLSESSVSIAANVSGTWNLTTFVSSPFYGYPWIPTHVEYVKVLGPIDAFKAYLPFGTDHATLIKDENGFYSTKTLEFRASSAVETSFVFHFGDGSPSVYIKGNVQGSGYGASAYHRFKKAGVFIIRVIAFNEFFNATQELGPYYVETAPKDLLLAMNSSTVHKDETILFKASLKTGSNVSYRWSINNKAIYGNEGPVIIYKFSTAATYNITVVAVNKVGNQTAWKIVSVQYKMKPVSIFTNGTIFSTGTSIRFYVITEEAGNLKFFWHFGYGKSETTTSTSISKTYTKPNRYNVIVTASNEISSITSDIHTIFIQSRVIPHSLVASSSVLVDASVTFECRTNSRANINYLWNFGDGSIRPGNNKTENHVFTREGEFTVNVLVFNNVSSAFLTKQIFVVKEPCQPPPVKIIGPTNQIQIRRYEHLHLRVTFEAPILCNISQGLHYYWSFVKSDGNLLSLPAHIENKRQAITLPKFFLAYGKYTAVAKVQIVGTIVYSNYTVPIEVLPTDPVSVIAEGTHLFIDQNTVKNITLNGTSSFDPDNPAAQLRFHWRCAPVSTHTDSCFKSSVSSPFQSSDEVIIFQTALLNSNFDQFHFTLNVSSGDRMSTDAHVFLSMKPKSNFRLVHLHCFECKGSSINWNEKISVQPVCSDCSETDDLSYSWNLYWINATDTINIEVPFCHAIEGMRHSGLHGLISMETSAEASMMQVTPSLASHATSSHLETTPEPSAFEGISNDTKTLESVSFNGESTESTFQETNFGRTVSQEGENDNISPTASAFDLTMLDMSNPLLGPLEEGSSGGRYARGRRSAVGTMSNNAHSDTSDWMNLMIEENKLRLEKIQKELSLANNEVDAWKGKDEYERLMGLAKVELRKIQDSIKFRKKKKYQRDWQDYQDKKVYDYTYSASSGSESEISSGEENKTQNSYREQQQMERDIDLLSTNEPLPDNLTKKQRTALKALQNDITITIKPSDKGGNIVVLNTKDYVEECQRQLRDIKQYSILRFNPTEIYKEKLFQILMRAKDEGVINQREFDFLFVKFPKTATFYSIPKLHKNKLPPPGRPIISGKGSLTEKISQYVDFCLRPNILNLPSYIKDTLDVLKKLNDISVSANTLLVAIDVESLYSSIPHDKGVEVIKYFLIQRGSEYDKHTNFILELLSFILKHNYFVFGNKCYQQNLGTAMGTCCAPTFACLYLGKWEFDQILNSAEINDSISLWLRFIDDVFLLWEDTEMKLIEFMQKLNNNEWNLKFTYTYSKNEITFLDLRIINDNNCLKTATFRKDTAGLQTFYDSSRSNKRHFQDFDTHLTSIQEGRGGSRGRSEGEISSIPSSLSDDEIPKEEEGDNLVDVSRLDNAPAAILMIDWFQHHISNSVFHSYTASGISSQTVIFNPFVLKSSNMYMLDLSVASRGNIIGKSQLYFTVNEMPQRITCAVRYKEGFELHTVFSIFCTSGQKDLHYEFSYQTGRSSRKILYKGRDNEYYFSLPSGDPAEFYRVTIFMEITNRFGSKTQQCPVNVTVLPIFARNTTGTMPEWDLYHNGLKNLSTLLLMGNHIEIRNYVVLVTEVLNRLYTEESKDPFDLQRKLQRKLRNSLISSVCSLPFQDQDEVTDITSMLTDLLNKTKQITTDSVTCIINAVKTIVKEYVEPVNHKAVLLDRTLSENLISLISKAMEISYNYSERNNYVILDGMKSISDLMLKYITMNNELQFNISTSLLEIQVNVHQNSQKDIQSIGSTRFNLPPLIDRHSIINIDSNNKCYISQLVHFKKNPYFWAVTSSQLHGEFAGLDVFHCSTRRKINVREFIMPVTMEFENQLNNKLEANENKFILARDKVNYHHFTATSKNKEEVLQITITFSDPNTRAFPVLVLVRYPEKPSTTHFNVKHIHYWEGNTTQIFISADSIRDRGSGYLALMDADYNRVPKNKYLSSQINYTINVQWAQCLFWDNYKQWKSEDCYPQKGTTAARINCSCKHLGMFTISSRHVNTQMNIEDVEQFIHAYTNVVPCAIVFLFILLYIVLLTFCKLKDKHEEKKNDCVLLQDNSPSDQQQYAIIVDIGFRSRPKSTAKVHIVLHGEDGVSETRELYCPDKPLFERNSRHTFIMSIPDSLGPIWKIHIWHNNSGDCPSLYLSHVIIKDLKYGTSWFFHAECWLAVDEGDGKVEREFTSTGHGPWFQKLFYCKLTEYLEDFHLWCSVLSRPSYSWFTHTQRITICLVLFLGYMSLNIVLIHWKEEQYTAEMGFIDISTVSMITGLQATMTIYPVALLLSLLFRFSEGHQNSLSAVDTMLESNLTWQHFQSWAYDAWKKKYERDFFTPSVHSVNSSKRSEKGSPLPSNQSSSGFEDGSNNSHKPDPRDYKQSKNDLCSEYSSDRSSLFENSVFHGYKVLPPWCVYVAWSLCALFSLSCVIVTVLVGFRFGPSKCILYLHALFFSLIYCIFIIQPFMIFLTALFVAWWKREQTDFFAEELRDATKYFLSDPMLFSQNFALYNQQNTHELVTNFDKILAARKRARYLRLARPPTPAQLRIVREKIRKKTLIQQTFWEFVMHIVMIFILLFIALGKFSHHEYILNQAVRNEFTRDAEHTFSKIKTEDEWWDWSVSTLLDGLYWDKWYNKAYATAEAGPIGGKFFLVGTPVLRQLRAASESTSSEEAKIPKRQVPLKIPPTLLVLSLPSQEEEPLAAKIRTSPDVSGVEIMNHECKLTLFADDILLSLMKPLVSLPNLYKLLDDYAEISGYKTHKENKNWFGDAALFHRQNIHRTIMTWGTTSKTKLWTPPPADKQNVKKIEKIFKAASKRLSTFMIPDAVSFLISMEWNKPDVPFVPFSKFKNMFPLPSEKLDVWETIPTMDGGHSCDKSLGGKEKNMRVATSKHIYMHGTEKSLSGTKGSSSTIFPLCSGLSPDSG
ncbi:LOW QUALITY PROTEIN: polycystic kidney disease protein 1-like 1 [Bombina bombina]|uniref:LOW QUALITY PROTEIN: polycystic kidney disease protein 1-like 1 n=1 Tax=Bombina bombina TaxID=8345 RepID=UPI00235A5634|nr:LOW QUALITY PROTEIN: polycystic kidney disease protein 1-like 1 [Bombina bombina]